MTQSLADSIKLIRKTLLPQSAALATINQLVELVAEMREALNNIGGNVYHGMVDDVGYKDKSPDWQYVLNQANQGLTKADALLTKLGDV